METTNLSDIYVELSNGLVLRRANPGDVESLLAINAELLGEDSRVEIEYVIKGGVPGMGLEDFLVIVEPGGRVVSSLSLLEQELRIGQTYLKIGNPEFVSTLPEYRGAGLIRQQFAVLDKLQKERGYAVSTITGIPYFYRLFGYEYALEDFRTGYINPATHLPKMADVPDLEVRRTVESDAPILAKLYAEAANRVDVAETMAESGWAWSARTREMVKNNIEDWVAVENGVPVAYARLHLFSKILAVLRFAGTLAGQQAIIKKALAWPELEKLSARTGRNSLLNRWFVSLGAGRTQVHGNYIKILNPVLAFQQLAPEFERRVAGSRFAGLTQTIELGFYRFGVALTFEDGKLVKVEPGNASPEPRLSFPPDLLPKILLGFRSLDELEQNSPDLVVTRDEDWELVNVLFPSQTNMMSFFL